MNRTPLEQAMFDALQPFGRMGASFPIYTSPPPEHEVIPCEDLLDTERLGGFLHARDRCLVSESVRRGSARGRLALPASILRS